jgi:AraC family transcriptional regulator
MLKPYNLLKNVLVEIENGIREGVNGDILARKNNLTERHLRRLFKVAFKQSIAGYIRSRRLAASLDDLLKTDNNVLDIALEYGYDYEHTYIRAFKREFGITPGDLRKKGKAVKIKPPLYLLDKNNLRFFLKCPKLVTFPSLQSVYYNQDDNDE